MRRAALLAVVAVATLAPEPAAAQLRLGHSALRSGRYDVAVEALERHAAESPDDAFAHRLWARALIETGRYAEAAQLAGRFAGQGGAGHELDNARGEALAALGRLDEADAAFSSAIAGGASDALAAEANRAVLRERRGRTAEAEAGFERLIDAYNASASLTSEELTAVGIACRHLGKGNPALFQDALKAFDEAVAADPGALEPRLALGELFLEKYDSVSAKESLEAVLAANPAHPGANLAMARARDFDGVRGVLELTRKALETNPSFVPARAFLAETLLALERYDDAEQEAQRALDTNPVSLEALAALAGARYLKGDQAGFERARERALAVGPAHAELFNTLADLCVRNRLYRQAADFAREAVRLDARSWRGHGLLGLNQLRLGEIEAGRASLETAFAGDPYNVWSKNTLDLLDTFEGYTVTGGGRFRTFVRRDERALEPIVRSLAREALAALEARYRYTLEGPVRIEVYPNHADFSVRTVGLAGLGALGVCFGNVVAIDSPKARPRGSFNWGSTLWHELAHAVTLGMTEHRVPRWLTEGISVHEERRARPGWGDDVNLGFLAAMQRDELLGIANLNDGFVRPKSPEQVGISYLQASLVVELIERDHGFEAVLGLLRGYRDRKSTEELFEGVLGTSLEAFDAAFRRHLEERWGHAVKAVQLRDAPERVATGPELVLAAEAEQGDFLAQLAAGRALLEGREPERAAVYLERAASLFPEYAEDDSPHWLLVRIAKSEGDRAAAARHLEAFLAYNETHFDAHLELAELRGEQARRREAAELLERALYVDPLDAALHLRLAALYEDLEDGAGAVRARRAVVDLDPVDRPEALYQLARAQQAAGELEGARRSVLEALELAPRFRRGQELLLELHRATSGGGGRP